MKKLQHHIRQLTSWLRSNRKILFPVLSALGVLFFVLCDYEYYPWATLFFLCIFMSYIVWGILHIKSFAIERDAEGNLVLYDKNNQNNQRHEQN